MAYEHSSLLGAKPAQTITSILYYMPCVFYSSIIALCLFGNIVPLLLSAKDNPTLALFCLQSGIANDWIYATIGSLLPPALESCVSVMLQPDSGAKGRRISKKSKSLNAITRAIMKLPTNLVSIYLAIGNRLIFFVMVIFQLCVIFIGSRLADRAQDLRAERDKALEEGNITKAWKDIEAQQNTDERTVNEREVFGIVQRIVNETGSRGLSQDNQTASTKINYTAGLNLKALFSLLRRFLLLFGFIVYCSTRRPDRTRLLNLSHRMLAFDDNSEKFAENIHNASRIVKLMMQDTVPYSKESILAILSNWAKACNAVRQAGWGGGFLWSRKVPG
ncbi:hypothetical protein F4808DRAFT_446511 [Astrocystis sublimbata]|nr:hypothetical protein F4808DRAFT_446511 [Astrocystis sublimbata]